MRGIGRVFFKRIVERNMRKVKRKSIERLGKTKNKGDKGREGEKKAKPEKGRVVKIKMGY